MAGQITHYWEGTKLVVTSDSGTTACDLKGEKGDIGVRGCQGEPGVSGVANLDPSLSIDGYAADAAVVGAKFTDLETRTAVLEEKVPESTAGLESRLDSLEESTTSLAERTTALEENAGSGSGGTKLYEHHYTFYILIQSGTMPFTLRVSFYDSNNEPKNTILKLHSYLLKKGYEDPESPKLAQGGVIANSEATKKLDTLWGVYAWGDYLNFRGTFNGLYDEVGIDTTTATEFSESLYVIREV